MKLNNDKAVTAFKVVTKKDIEDLRSEIRDSFLIKKEILTIDEASRFTGLAKSTLYKHTSSSSITYYKTDKRIYFKREDLEKWLLSNKIPSIDDLNENLDYRMLNSKRRGHHGK